MGPRGGGAEAVAALSICSLIYRSPIYAEAVFGSLVQHTPQLIDPKKARFFFLANDATDDVKWWLANSGIDYIEHENTPIPEEELLLLGYGGPEYISRVYRAWNRAILESDDLVVLVNSDMMFSPGWLDELLAVRQEFLDKGVETFVCSKLVEDPRGHLPVFPGALQKPLGLHPENFDERGFEHLVEEFRAKVDVQKEPAWHFGGAYMPCLMSRRVALEAGLYPAGNRPSVVKGKLQPLPASDYGDREFVRKLEERGVRHVTANRSLVYHFKEGEMRE